MINNNKINFRISNELKQEFKEYCKNNNISISLKLRELIIQALKE